MACLLAAGLALAGAVALAPQAPKRRVIGMSQCNLGEPWRQQMNADVRKAAAAHPGLEVVFKDAQNDSLVQRAHVEELVARRWTSSSSAPARRRR